MKEIERLKEIEKETTRARVTDLMTDLVRERAMGIEMQTETGRGTMKG